MNCLAKIAQIGPFCLAGIGSDPVTAAIPPIATASNQPVNRSLNAEIRTDILYLKYQFLRNLPPCLDFLKSMGLSTADGIYKINLVSIDTEIAI